MKNILFICTGNTCRSSMAEGILRSEILKDEALKDNFTVSSAGVNAFEGDGASRNSILVLKNKWGIDISDHKAKLVSRKMVHDAHIILTMTRSHKDVILSYFPEMREKTVTLREYINSMDKQNKAYQNPDICDPYGQDIPVYEKCAEEIYEAINNLKNILKSV